MGIAETIAGILGPVYVVVGLGMLADPETYRTMVREFMESPALRYLGGLLALAAGLIILALHPGWKPDWTALITLLGWMACLKGAVLLIRPRAIEGMANSAMRDPGRVRVTAGIAVALGLFFSAMAYLPL